MQTRRAFTSLSLLSVGSGAALYGVSAILVLYLYAPVHAGGLGLDRISAAQLVALFSALSFTAGVLGSYAADRLAGTRAPLTWGTGLRVIGIMVLAWPYPSLGLLSLSIGLQIIGSGLMGQCLNALTGALYAGVPGRLASAFSTLYITNNIGAAAPLITGMLALRFGYPVGFFAGGGILLLTAFPFIVMQKRWFGAIGSLPVSPLPRQRRHHLVAKSLAITGVIILLVLFGMATHWLSIARASTLIGCLSALLPVGYVVAIYGSPQTTSHERPRVLGFTAYLIGNAITMMIYGQSTGILAIYAADSVRLNWLGIRWTPAVFQTVPALFAILFGTLMAFLWSCLGQRQPPASLKYGVGLVLWGLGPAFMALPLRLYPASQRVSPLWLIGFYLLIVLGESLTSPVGTAMATRIAPHAFATQMITVFALSQSAGSALAAVTANWYRPGHEAAYFTIIGAIGWLAGVAMLLNHRRLSAMTEQSAEV